MSRRTFVNLFVALAMCFVPVIIHLMYGGCIVPAGFSLFRTMVAVFRLDPFGIMIFGFYSAFYLGVFYVLARVVWCGIGRLTRSAVVARGLQAVVLAALFSCSFFRVITYVTILDGNRGTYTFWSAVGRASERGFMKI